MESSGQERTFCTGSVRDGGKKPALQLISPHAMMRLGEWLRYAVEDRKPKPYPKRNWEKGQPFSEIVASLQRHVEKFKLGDTSEDHIAAILFGGMALAHYEEEIKAGRLDPALDDMPHYFDRGRVTITGGSEIERKVQAKLDETFADAETVYAHDNLKKGNAFSIAGGKAYSTWSDVPEGLMGVEGFATEDIPAGAPMRVTTKYPRDQAMWEIALGTTRIGATGGLERFVDFRKLAKGQVMTLGVDLASGPDMTVVSMIEGTRKPMSSAKEAEILELNAARRQRVEASQAPFTVYLCGPITGQEVDYTWRAAATAMLQAHGIRTLDPLRGKHRDQISDLGLGYRGQLAAPEIADRDQMDVQEADVILAHFPYNPPRQSIGSLMEMGAAAIGYGKPVVLCTTIPVFNDHLFCRNFTTLEPNFEQALNRIVAMATAKRR